MESKKLFTILLLSVFVLSFASAFDWDNSTISYYKLDEVSGSVLDAHGPNDGTNNGATPNVPGKINTAYDFDGNDYINIGSTYLDSNTTGTIQAWINVDSFSTEHIIFGAASNSDSNGLFQFRTETTGKLGIWTGTPNNNLISTAALSIDTWYHVVLTSDGSTTRIYINGIEDTLVGTNNGYWIDKAATAGTTEYNIGALPRSSGRIIFFDGTIDEFGLWGRPVTPDEVTELYNSGDGLPYGTSTADIEITLESPSNETTISDIGTNFTVSGNNLTEVAGTWENVTYNVWSNGTIHNQTTVSLSGETFNNTQFIDDFGFETYVWNAEACYTNITGDYCISAENNNTLYVSLFTIISETYVNTTIAGTLENFSISIDLLEGYELLSADFLYNGTSNSPSIIAVGDNRFLLVSDYQIPILTADENISFLWGMTFTGDNYINSTERTQLVRAVMLDNCSTYTYNIFNISLFDERDKTPLSGDIELVYSLLNKPAYQEISTFNFSADGVTNTEVCSGIDLTGESVAYSAEIRYESTGYAAEFYYIQEADMTGDITNINLFDLNLNQSTEFTVSYKNNAFIFIEEAVIQLQRKYIGEDIYETVEAPLTGNGGKAVLHVDLNTYKYRASVVKDGEVLDFFDNIVFECGNELSGDCTHSLDGTVDPNNDIPVSAITDFAYSISIDEQNKTMTVLFSVPSGTPSLVNVFLEQRDMFGNSTACNKTVITSAGSITCDYTDSIEKSILELSISKNGVELAVKGYVNDPALDMDGMNYFIIFLFMISLVGMAISSPEWMVMISVMVLIISGTLLLVSGMSLVMGLGAIAWLVIAAAIILFKMAKQEDK